MQGSRIVTLMFVMSLLMGVVSGQSPVSQSAELKGVVTDETKAIIPGATLSLFGQHGRIRDAVSAGDGSFSFGELPLGKYKLVVKKEGFADRELSIELDGRTRDSELVLSTDGVSETVTVVMDSAEAAVESTLKSPVSIHETPRSLSVIGSERIQEQNFRQVSDVLNYVPGTSQNSYRNGSYHFYSRGYRMGPEDTRVDGFAGVNVGGGGFGASTFGVEEIVVLRGPASLIYGQTGSPGGLINLVTKRPREQYRTQVDLRTMGYQGNGVSLDERPGVAVDVDSTGPLFGSDRIFYRALASVEQMNYFTKDTLDRNRYVNGSLTFKLDREGRYLLTPSTQYVRYYRPYGGGIVASPSSSLSAAVTGPAAVGDPRAVVINDDDLSPLDVNLFGGRRIEETAWGGIDLRGAVTDKVRISAAYRYVSFDTEINSFTPQATTAAQITRLRHLSLIDRVQSKSLTERNYNNLNADFSYEWLNNGWVKNTTMVGFYSRILDSRTVSGGGSAHSPINVYTGAAGTPLVDNITLPALGAWGRDVILNTFVQNTTAIDNGRWLVTVGLNYGRNTPAATAANPNPAVRKSGLIPNASLVFNATPELALYGSYSTSFNPVDPTLQNAEGNTGGFDPTLGKSYEVGAKYDLLNRRVSLTLAAFQNQIENALVQSDLSVLNPNGQRFWVPAGTRRSRGFEMTGDFQVRQDLRVSGGASYTAAIYKGFPGGLTSNGAPPAASPIPNSWAEKTPHWSYNFYTRYDRAEGYLKGFGAGFGMSWQGKRLGSNGARTFASPDPLVLPAFTKADTALFYRLNKFVNFALNVDNVFDEVIFVNASVGSAIEIAAPRTLTLRTSFNF
jgi:iron complex outermembrane receptor protein